MAINRVNLAVLRTFDSSNSVCHNKNKNTCIVFNEILIVFEKNQKIRKIEIKRTEIFIL